MDVKIFIVGLIVTIMFLQGVQVQYAGHCPNGQQLLPDWYCGRGGTPCPHTHYCLIAPNDAYADCCTKPTHSYG